MPEIIEMTDFEAPELDVFFRRSERQLQNRERPVEGLFIAESGKVITRALDAGCEPVKLLLEKKHVSGKGREIISRCTGAEIYCAELEMLMKMTGYGMTRGMLCAMRRPRLPEVREVCSGRRRIAVMEDVVNPTNVGAIFRSAAALGMEAVLLTRGSCDPLYRRAIRVSMGTVFQVPWTFLGENWTEELHGLGFKTAAMALDKNSVGIDDPALNGEERLAVVLGTEGDGLRKTTIAGCDYTVMIPMSAGVDSLNVAAASAVAFWQLGRRQDFPSQTGK